MTPSAQQRLHEIWGLTHHIGWSSLWSNIKGNMWLLFHIYCISHRWFQRTPSQVTPPSVSLCPPSSLPLHLRHCGHTRRQWGAGWWGGTVAVPRDSDFGWCCRSRSLHLSRCHWQPRDGGFRPEIRPILDFLEGAERWQSETQEQTEGSDEEGWSQCGSYM